MSRIINVNRPIENWVTTNAHLFNRNRKNLFGTHAVHAHLTGKGIDHTVDYSKGVITADNVNYHIMLTTRATPAIEDYYENIVSSDMFDHLLDTPDDRILFLTYCPDQDVIVINGRISVIDFNRVCKYYDVNHPPVNRAGNEVNNFDMEVFTCRMDELAPFYPDINDEEGG